MATVTVSIGRNVRNAAGEWVELSATEWARFRRSIAYDVHMHARNVFVKDAASVGEWDGRAEDSRTWVLECDADLVPALREAVRLTGCVTFRQDAVAFTVGETDLITA